MWHIINCWASLVTRLVKNLPANVGDTRDGGSIPGLGRSPEDGNGNPLQQSCLENFMDRGAWQATVHGVAKTWTRLSMHACTHTYTHIINGGMASLSYLKAEMIVKCSLQHTWSFYEGNVF